jgi:type IV pilus assembly protein PilN
VRRINLVPPSERQRTATDVGMLGLIGLAVVVIFGLGMGYYLLSGQLDQKKQDLEGLQQQVAQLKLQVAALESYEQLASERSEMEKSVQQIYARRTLVADVLDDISQVVPETAWFTNLEITTSDILEGTKKSATSTNKDGSLSIDGNTYSFEEVAEIMVRLELIPALSDVMLIQAGTADKGAFSKDVKAYSIQAAVSNKQPEDVALPLSQGEVAAQ